MKSLLLTVDDNVYEKIVNFLKTFPPNKFKIVEEISCTKKLEKELKNRKKEINEGKIITNNEFWKDTGI